MFFFPFSLFPKRSLSRFQEDDANYFGTDIQFEFYVLHPCMDCIHSSDICLLPPLLGQKLIQTSGKASVHFLF